MLRVDHDCEINVKQDDFLFLPSRGPLQKILDCFRRFIMASNKSPTARKYLRSNFAISSEKRRHLRNFKEVIHPFSLFRYVKKANEKREKIQIIFFAGTGGTL